MIGEKRLEGSYIFGFIIFRFRVFGCVGISGKESGKVDKNFFFDEFLVYF